MVRKKCYINFNNKNAGIYISVRQNKFCDKNIFIIMKSIIKRHIIINIYISHNRIIKHMRQKLIEQVDRKSVKTWKIWGTLSTNKSKIQIISSADDTLTMIDPFLGHIIILNKFKIIQVLINMLSDYMEIKV